MKKNLALIEKHRLRMGLLLAFIIFLFIYLCFAIFWITSVSYIQKIEHQKVDVKVLGVQNLLRSRETVKKHNENDKETEKVVQTLVANSFIVSRDGGVIDYIDNGRDFITEENLGKNIYQDGYLYNYSKFSHDGDDFDIVVRVPSRSFQELNLYILLSLIAFGPFLYGLLAFVSNRILHRVYVPIIDTVANLEAHSMNINHEFKTSLSEIISTLELSQITGETDQAIKQSLDSSKRLNNILDSLSQLINYVNSDYRRKKTNIISLFDDVIKSFEKQLRKKNLTIVKHYDPDRTLYRSIDTEPLELTFINIFKNAIRYSHAGGTIDIKITKFSFSIKDHGVGIEEKNLDKIFSRYFRENYNKEGFGVGLSLVKNITEKYGWEVKVESKKGKFTKFSVKF